MVGSSTIGCGRRRGGYAAGHPGAGTESGARWQHWRIFSGGATARSRSLLANEARDDDDLGAAFAAGGRPRK